jgi:hypothetical protein
VTQATVRSWDDSTGGSAFLDDGTVIEIPRDALQGSVFRFLRSGQRVRLVLDGGVVVAVDLP